MDPDLFEKRMRAGECFHSLRLMPGAWAVLRVDGRGFTRFTETRFEKPFDARFRDAMLAAARALMTELNGLYAYAESDEISVLFPPEWDLFDRELEKLVSLSAGVASAAFSLACGAAAAFDSRAWLGAGRDAVRDYFLWRQSDAARCALNGWCYWTLRSAGQTAAQATRTLEGQSVGFKNELLFRHGVNFNDVPLWQRRGVGLYRETYPKPGRSPLTGEEVTAIRRRLRADEELPMREEYARFLERLLQETGQESHPPPPK